MADETAVRIELAFRAGMLAKAALGLFGSSPNLARLHLMEVAKLMRDLDEYLKKQGL